MRRVFLIWSPAAEAFESVYPADTKKAAIRTALQLWGYHDWPSLKRDGHAEIVELAEVPKSRTPKRKAKRRV